MRLILIGAIFLGILIYFLLRAQGFRERRELARHTIHPRELHALMAAKADLLLLDVRLPLDLLAHPETIPGARRVCPKDFVKWVESVPRDRQTVFYCTCSNDETSLLALRRAFELNFTHIRILKDGIAGWKAQGYPVEPYDEAFHLDSADGAPESDAVYDLHCGWPKERKKLDLLR